MGRRSEVRVKSEAPPPLKALRPKGVIMGYGCAVELVREDVQHSVWDRLGPRGAAWDCMVGYPLCGTVWWDTRCVGLYG